MKALVALAVVCALGIAACGGDDTEGPAAAETTIAGDEGAAAASRAEDAAAEQAYLDALSRAQRITVANFQKFEALFDQVWPLPSAMFDALQRAGAGTAFDEGAAAIAKLEPPARHATDHQILLALGKEMMALDREVGKAVADQDVVAFARANVRLGQASRRAALRLSAPVCEALNVREEDPAATRSCTRPDEGEGGEYGKALFELMVKMETDVRPLVEVFVPQFAIEDLLKVLAGYKPDMIAGLEQIKTAAEGLSPPPQFQHDHQTLLLYLEQQLEAAQLIPDEPTSDPGGPSAPPGPPGVAVAPPECFAGEFSADFLRLVAVHFGEPNQDCPPGPPPGPPQ